MVPSRRDAIVWRLAELGNTFYGEGRTEEFKQHYKESFSLAKKEVGRFAKRDLLLLLLTPLHAEDVENSVRLLGAIHLFEVESKRSIDPMMKRFYDRAEIYARNVLEDSRFETVFAEGWRLSLDEAIDLAQKTVEEIE